MLDETAVSPTGDLKSELIWGIPVLTMPSGLRRRPEVIKELAEQRVADGAAPRDIAKEIGIRQSMLRKWLRRDLMQAPR